MAAAAAAAALTVDECMWCTSETRHQAARRLLLYPALSSSEKKIQRTLSN